jgi:hypothetical protein
MMSWQPIMKVGVLERRTADSVGSILSQRSRLASGSATNPESDNIMRKASHLLVYPTFIDIINTTININFFKTTFFTLSSPFIFHFHIINVSMSKKVP